jgi:hypothetical protein
MNSSAKQIWLSISKKKRAIIRRSDQFITEFNLVISADIHISPIYQWVWKINASSNVPISYGSYGMDKLALDV